MPDSEARPARIDDVHELALAMPFTKVYDETSDHPVYQVGGKSFVFFRNPRPDAVDPETGERYDDVIVFWVPSESDKQALVQDASKPYFTTPHFDGHLSVLVRASRIGELTRRDLRELIQDGWLSQASARRVIVAGGTLTVSTDRAAAARVRYPQIAFDEYQDGDSTELGNGSLFWAATASDKSFLQAARAAGVSARGWDFDSASLATSPLENYPATDTPYASWYQTLTQSSAV